MVQPVESPTVWVFCASETCMCRVATTITVKTSTMLNLSLDIFFNLLLFFHTLSLCCYQNVTRLQLFVLVFVEIYIICIYDHNLHYKSINEQFNNYSHCFVLKCMWLDLELRAKKLRDLYFKKKEGVLFIHVINYIQYFYL